MRPPFNSFQPQGRPRRPQQQQHQNNGYSNHHQRNGYQNPMEANQLRMMNPHMMSNPMMGHMNNPMPMPNMPMHPQFFNNLPNMPQHQQQLHQFAAMPNHINQLLPNLLGNLQFAVANSNLMAHSLPLVQPQFFQPQLNSFNPRPYPPVPNPHQNHQLQPPGFSEPRPLTGGIVDNNTNGSGSKGNDFRNKFTKHQKFNGPGQGFQRSQLHQADNGKRKSGFNKDHRGKGNYNKMTTGFNGSDAGNIANEKKRSFALVYTPKEIKQWRESRRKNYPTKLNVAKKVKKNVSESILDEEAKMRRQQLQEVLAKQAELGVEVAEVPSHYLSNTDEQVNGDGGNNNGKNQYNDGQKGRRFQNNRHKKRRPDRKDKSSKKTRFEDKTSSQESSVITREPTLLEKLLSGDIKRNKSQLLQVIRFMAMNSLFKEFPEQPLKLPLITVEETGCEHGREDDVSLCDDLSDDDDDDVDVDVNGDDNSCDEDVD
ncbi:PREDICTED: GATA zinc finger domain-containing protein 14-like isoform X2 [Camelina sativa]|uniref:GATA zinc finger domain-containing protein 14-like isoform X2 n=1 Tax=Camelina sativa TaxID=90675 RepID=A0ABM0VCC1_CAMSA|nr:PREDICTED: GATA zinc finger domain-containing protein 14-like isoform X2 [Camelina sativa]